MKTKRKLFDELMDGVESMQHEREVKITLRTHEVDDFPHLKAGSREELNPVRKQLF